MNTQTRKESEATNARGAVEERAETVEYRSSPGQRQEEVRSVEVIHEYHPQEKPNTSGGILESAANAAASTLQSIAGKR